MNNEFCKELVFDSGGWHKYQCSRKAVKDGYCKQHHPDAVAERRKKSEEAYEAKREQSDWRRLARAQERIALLESIIAECPDCSRTLKNTEAAK